jgi:hypothetical protein
VNCLGHEWQDCNLFNVAHAKSHNQTVPRPTQPTHDLSLPSSSRSVARAAGDEAKPRLELPEAALKAGRSALLLSIFAYSPALSVATVHG